MPKNYHINKEIDRVALDLSSKGFHVYKRVSRRGVPHLIINGEVSLCFFWKTKQWKAFDWNDPQNRTLTQKDPDKIVAFVDKHFEKELSFEVVKKA